MIVRIKCLLLIILFLPLMQVLYATNYYCDPVNGSMENDGLSRSSAWQALEIVISGKEFSPGDSIFLMSGNHGSPFINKKNSGEVVVTRLSDDAPLLNRIVFDGASHWKIESLKISSNGMRVPVDPPLEHPVYPLKENSLVQIVNSSSNISISNCYIFSIDNSSGWTKEDWNYKAWNGIYNTQNSDVTIQNCHLKNINFGIENTASCVNNLYEYNVIENFGGDGMRAHGTHTIIQYNVVKNSYDTNGNHDDLIQAFQKDQVGLVLRGNILIAYTDANQPFKSVCQGIGFFDGMFRDFIIENNIVATNHWHGITLLGAINCKIINNTVVDLDNTDSPVPWIMIDNNKDGTPSSGCIIRNNITPDIKKGAGVATDHNLIVPFSQYKNYFVDFDLRDLHLKKGSPAIDKGSADQAPTIDIETTKRPQGNGFDIGAYEFDETTTGLNNIKFNRDLPAEFYPNPTSGKLNYAFREAFSGKIIVSDISGKKVLEKKISTEKGSFDLSNKKNGLYFVLVESANHYRYKILKL